MCAGKIKSASTCSLIEKEEDSVPINKESSSLEFAMGAFEIKTFLLTIDTLSSGS